MPRTKNPLTPEQRAEVARQNGRKSQGPKTQQGREASSRNATTHGAYTRNIVLPNEDPELYLQFKQQYLDEWQPVGQRERDLVVDLVNARWRMTRIVYMETAAIPVLMERQRAHVAEEFKTLDEGSRTALAYIGFFGEPEPGMIYLAQCEARLMRTIARATKLLTDLQDRRKASGASASSADPLERPGDTLTPTPGSRYTSQNEETEPGVNSGPEPSAEVPATDESMQTGRPTFTARPGAQPAAAADTVSAQQRPDPHLDSLPRAS
jgi:hypothetical protein